MKKGFTLVELLIVMVIVGVLVTVALPKYRASMERGRATEGITNLKAASDWINTQYILHDGTYPDNMGFLEINGEESQTVFGHASRSVYFTAPVLADSCPDADKCLQTSRKQGNEIYYTLTAYNKDGELIKITCTGTEKALCENLGKMSADNSLEF